MSTTLEPLDPVPPSSYSPFVRRDRLEGITGDGLPQDVAEMAGHAIR